MSAGQLVGVPLAGLVSPRAARGASPFTKSMSSSMRGA